VEDSIDPETGEMSQNVQKIKGWIYIPLKGVGGRDPQYYEEREARKARLYEKRKLLNGSGNAMDGIVDEEDEANDLMGGDILRAMILQVRICENHQNGKDTHVRGFQVFAKDETVAKDMRKTVKVKTKPRTGRDAAAAEEAEEELVGLKPAEWMGEQDLR